jgi:hypothetical protein
VDTYYTYANSSTWWKFTTLGGTPPGAFNKTSPANNATGISTHPNLTWSASSGVSSYEYCIDTSNDSACTSPATWTDVGNVTSFGLSGLNFSTAYYWQVRAKNAGGTTDASGGWWKFTTQTAQKINLPLIMKGVITSPSTLLNGDFEQGAGVGWEEYSALGWDIILSSGSLPVTPHSGNWAAWLGGDYGEDSYISQNVKVNAGDSYLHLWYWINSVMPCGLDYGYVMINSSNLQSWDLCDSTDTGGWVELILDLSAYAGQTVTLKIRATTTFVSISNLSIDDVSFAATLTLAEYSPPAPRTRVGLRDAVIRKDEILVNP